ncbi:MAG: substrate-binding domain-containing protein, partial [Akkermansiaceae bacterium]|nr:substrate-binding domain-containing protein [Akkermansiaceae bacterium]
MRHYERELLGGIADYAKLHGPWQFQRNVSYLADEQLDPLKLLERWQPDALIVRESRPRHYDKILHTGRPTVYSPTTECREGVPNIVVNDREAGRMAADHLHEAGLRHFAYCGVRSFFWSRRRGEGYGEQVRGLGHEVQVFDSAEGREFFGWDSSHDRLVRWLRGLPKPVGLFCCTDDFTLLVQE